MATLLLSQGVPMILSGDEMRRTQGGNNNPYCQDNEIGWIDWSGLGRSGDDMTDFIGGLARLRKRFAQLRTRHWLEGKKVDGSHDVLWLRPDGTEMREEDWHFPEGRLVAYVLAPPSPDGEALLLVFNAAANDIEVTLPSWPNVQRWSRVLDTKSGLVLAKDITEHPGGKFQAPAVAIVAFAGQP
jgi:glycogen operon protein